MYDATQDMVQQTLLGSDELVAPRAPARRRPGPLDDRATVARLGRPRPTGATSAPRPASSRPVAYAR
jgi:hypothetical protein